MHIHRITVSIKLHDAVVREGCVMKRSQSSKSDKAGKKEKGGKKEKNMVSWRETVQSYLTRVGQRYRSNCARDGGSVASPEFLEQLAASIADDHVPAKVRHRVLSKRRRRHNNNNNNNRQ